MKSNSKCNWVRLGDYITQCDERNSDGSYTLESVRGISIEKKIIFTKANMDGVSLTPYKLFKPEEFCFVTITSRNGNKITLSMNYEEETFLVSSSYVVFKVNDKNVLLPDYLYLLFCRPEFDRYARFNSWGSAREAFSYDEMCRVEIPLPSLSDQQKVVNAWKSLREVKEQNEAIAAPLMQVCQSYIQELKHKYKAVEIGEFIKRIDERNSDNTIQIVKSVSVTKEFNDTNAKVDKSNLKNYKIVRPNQISFVQTTGNEKCLCSAINHFGYPIVVTSVNEVFETNMDVINPDFLHMWFRRTELDRYARFHSWGSARETFTWDDMKRVRIPLPPLSVQQAIVNIYNCANEAKRIAAEADRMSREVCPALIQHVVNN